MNDRQAETRAAGFVEPTTTLSDQPLTAFGKPGAVVFDDKTERGMLLDRRHTHKRNSITMTGFAFVFGVAPMVVASGASSKSQQALGTGVMGGMIAVVVLALLMGPLFYVVVQRLFVRQEPKEVLHPDILRQR